MYFREDRQTYLNLQSHCKSLKADIQRLDKKCSSEMVKRFGEGVTLDDLEALGVNRTLEELKEMAKRKEEKQYSQLDGKEV